MEGRAPSRPKWFFNSHKGFRLRLANGARKRQIARRPRHIRVEFPGAIYHAADTLGMKSGVSASRQVRKAMTLKEEDRKTKRLIATIEEVLQGQGSVIRPA